MKMRRHDQHGFTLMEILLAVLLSGVVLVSIYGVFAQGLRVGRFFERRGEVSQDSYWIMTTLTRDLENMAPYSLPGTPGPFFMGSGNEICLVLASETGLQRVRYRLLLPETGEVHTVVVNEGSTTMPEAVVVERREEEERRRVLVRELRAFPFRQGEEEVLLRQVMSNNAAPDGLRFYYQRDAQSSWEDKWNEAGWPVRVRVDVLLLDSEGQERRLVKDVLIVSNQEQGTGLYAEE